MKICLAASQGHLTQLLEVIVAECLGLPLNFLQKFNDDRDCDLMVALHYFQATEFENTGNSEHQDGNLITILLQDEVGGLEVRKDGEWIPVTPSEGTLIVNIGDIIQVNIHMDTFQFQYLSPFGLGKLGLLVIFRFSAMTNIRVPHTELLEQKGEIVTRMHFSIICKQKNGLSHCQSLVHRSESHQCIRDFCTRITKL